jgi:hypothetical protein
MSVKATIVNEREAHLYFNEYIPDSTRFAMANTASRIAFLGIEKSNKQFRQEFDLSNKYLTGSAPGKGVLKFNRAIPHHNLNKIESSWGVPPKRGNTDLDFLEDQETGFTHKGMVPTKNAYPGRDGKKAIKRNLRRYNIEIMNTAGLPGKTVQQRALFFLRQAYLNRFAMPGSKQFLYIRPREFNNFSEGMYQFTSGSPVLGGQFPKMRMIYAKNDKVNKRRKATHWMQESANDFKQSEIDKIYADEFNKAFTRGLRRRV